MSNFEEVMTTTNKVIQELNNELDNIQQHIEIYLREISDIETQTILGFNIRNADLIHLLENLDFHMVEIEDINLDLSKLLKMVNESV